MSDTRLTTSPGSVRESLFFFLLAVLFLIPGLDRGLIFDEYKTRMVTELPWGDLVNERLGAGHLPTYFMMVKAWLGLVGYSDWAMRIPGALMAALGTIPFYFIGLRLGGRSAARWTAFIYLCNQHVLWAGQAARPYGPLLLFEGVTVLGALQWWINPRVKWLVMAGVGALLGMMMMPLSGLLIAALLIGVLVTARGAWHRALPLAGTLLAALLVGLLPAILVGSSQSKLSVDRQWVSPNFLKITEALATMTYGDYDLWARGIMQYLAELVLVLALVVVWRRWRAGNVQADDPLAAAGDGTPWRTWLMFWILVPLVALVLVSSFTGEAMVSHSRYQAPALGGVVVLLGLALARLRARLSNRLVRDGITILLLAPLVITAMAWHREPGEGVGPVMAEIIRRSDGQPPRQLAGHVRWFRWELPNSDLPARELFIERRPLRLNEALVAAARDKGNDVQIIDYDKNEKDVSAVRASVASWAGAKPFWLVVYIQQKDGLDRLANNPPTGYKLRTTLRKKFARAYYFEPTSI